MTPEEQAEAARAALELKVKEFNQFQLDIKSKQDELEKLIADKADEVSTKAINDAIENLTKSTSAKMDEINKILISQGTIIANMKNQAPKEVAFKSLNEAITHAVMSQKSAFDAIVENGGVQKEPLFIKAVVDISTLNTIGAGSTQYSLTENTGVISSIRMRETVYRANVSVGGISGKYAMWIEETTQQGTPVMLAEGAAKTQLSTLFVEKTEAVKKCAVYGKVTTEMLADLPQLIAYIQNYLMKKLDIKIEDELFNGTGVGDELKGIDAYAAAFTGGALALSVTAPNELDVIEAIALQVKEAFGIPTALFIHPSTMSAIKLIKDDAKRPVWKDYVTTNGMMNVSGLNLIETTAVDAGDFIGGDTSVIQVRIREELGIQIGLDGNDFTNNKKTMLAEKRLVQFVSANDAACLIKGDFTTAKAAITAV